jgi:SAM-dependent methyltransferase
VLSKLARNLDKLEAGNVLLQESNRHLEASYRELQKTNFQLCKSLHKYLAQEMATDRADVDDVRAADGLPVPAPFLRSLVAGLDDLDIFFASGRCCARALHEVLARQAMNLNQFARVLDFGCGCGRVLRYLKDFTQVEFHGADANRLAVDWCNKNLPFVRARVNTLEPPLGYPSGHFNLVFVFSVFTHLSASLQTAWMKELRRVLVPGGHLVVTVVGERRVKSLTASERADFELGRLVVREADFAGTNYCAVFHPDSYVRSVLARGFEVVDLLPEAPDCNPPQDIYLLRSLADRQLS